MGKAKGAAAPQKAGGKSKQTKKVKQDTFLKKEWRRVYIPGIWEKTDRCLGWTVSHKTARGRQPLDYVGGRVFELSYGADLRSQADRADQIFKWKTVAVENDDVLSVFAGMRITRDKLGASLKKYRTLIEGQADVKTVDGYILRIFALTFTKAPQQKARSAQKWATYCNQSQKRVVRDAMIQTIKDVAEKATIVELCKALTEGKIPQEIAKVATAASWEPEIEEVQITKVKVLRAPVITPEQLKDMHSGRALQVKATPAEVPEPSEIAAPQ